MIFALVGPTGSGKTELSLELAPLLGAEIVSVDSMQVYRNMDIGTAKATDEQRSKVPHHMVDIVDADEPYSVAEFQGASRRAIADIRSRDTKVLIVGGSGLHLRAVIDPMEMAPTDPDLRRSLATEETDELVSELSTADPEVAGFVDLANRRRVIRAVEILRLTGATPSQRASTDAARRYREYIAEFDVSLIGVDAGDAASARISARASAMFKAGLVDEVKSLNLGLTARAAIGYKQVMDAPDPGDVEAMVAEVTRSTMALVKRQRTFFRRDPRIAWMPWAEDASVRLEWIRNHWSIDGS